MPAIPRPTPTPDSYLWDICRAIALRLSLIDHLPEIHIRQVFAKYNDDPEEVTVITPEMDEYGDVQAFLGSDDRRSSTIDYTFRIGVLSAKNEAFKDIDPWQLYYREQMRQRLDEPILRTTNTQYESKLILGPINDEAAQGQGWNCTSMQLIVSSIEPATGLLVSNQEG